jgi:hypothetical protein
MARGRKTSLRIELAPDQRQTLEFWQRCTTLPAGKVRRARLILLLAEGRSVSDISRTVGMRRRHVATWAKRFIEKGIDGLQDKPGRGRKPFFPSGSGHPPRQNGVRKTG